MELERLVHYLNEYLSVADHPDYRYALNGLQVQGPGPVEKIAVAVDASAETISATVDAGCDVLIVHHGLYWGGLQPLVGPMYAKVHQLLQAGVALYAAHLPLDSHPEVGNAAVLARAVGVEITGPFGDYEGASVGWRGRLDMPREILADHLSDVVGGPVKLIPGGPKRVESVGVITGGAGSLVPEAAAAGVDAFITGEGAHYTYHQAMELGINVYYAGHYATETWGVQALALHLETEHGLAWEFLEFPTGL